MEPTESSARATISPRFECDLVVSGFSVKYRGATWINALIKKYDFKEGRDFVSYEDLSVPNSASSKARPQRVIEYALSIHMAKAISMVARDPKAIAARDYFIACEKKLLEILSRPTGLNPPHEMSLKEHIAYEMSLLQASAEHHQMCKLAGGW